MFYSHDILTSPEHGVATIWLVATLGSRSVTRRVNRKAILDVDVTEACRVIINPHAPMALRLQGSLLYGISRVFQQQCGYTLFDTQSMHDRMTSMLKQIPGGGLDPSAGKTKPSNLVLPYDPAFLPETGLRGIDFSFIDILPGLSQSAGRGYSPEKSQTSLIHLGSVQLDLPSDLLSDLPNVEGDMDAVSRKRGPDDEDGILLQPDFEFDEYGNIVEFDASPPSPKRRRVTSAQMGSRSRLGSGGVFTMETDNQSAVHNLDGDMVHYPDNNPIEVDLPINGNKVLFRESVATGEDEPQPLEERQQVPRMKKPMPIMPIDYNTTLRNTELARWNESYSEFMNQAAKQKQQNKVQTIVKANAAFWVFGQGIGSVGTGLGTHREAHPLHCYSGNQYFSVLSGDSNTIEVDPKQRVEDDEEDLSTPTKKPRGSHNDEVDVEIGRDAPSSVLYDDHSSQAPWNITASIKSSQLGLHRSAGDISVRGLRDSTGFIGSRIRGRLTSASPLAGRGLRERLSSLTLHDGLTELEDIEITQYLETNLAEDNEDISALSVSRQAVAIERAVAVLDKESLNFLDFIRIKTEQSGFSGEVSFSEILPLSKTTRSVATQGFMNVLTLATRGVLDVSQEPSKDAGPDMWPGRFKYGEIFMQPRE